MAAGKVLIPWEEYFDPGRAELERAVAAGLRDQDLVGSSSFLGAEMGHEKAGFQGA